MLNSQYISLTRARHAKALRSPMTRIKMEGDPLFTLLEREFKLTSEDDDIAAGRAQLERRACQYASYILSRSHGLDAAHYRAIFDGNDTITFSCANEDDIYVTIPRYIMEFDPDAPAMVESHETTPAETLSLF